MKLYSRFTVFILCVLAAVFYTIIPVQASNNSIIINGTALKCTSVIKNGRILVPVRGILESAGVSVNWDGATQTVLASYSGKTLKLKINNQMAEINGLQKTIDMSPTIISGNTYIPVRFICETFGMSVSWNEQSGSVFIINPVSKETKTPILAKPSATLAQAQAWARKRGATAAFIELAPYYWQLCSKCDIDPVVAYTQSAKETAFGRFGGVLDASFYNPCGLKCKITGSDKDANAHMRFVDWQTGIQAHIDHLALYVGVANYPKADSPDQRQFPFILGTARYVEDLGGKWAPSKDYGTSIVKYMNELKNTH